MQEVRLCGLDLHSLWLRQERAFDIVGTMWMFSLKGNLEPVGKIAGEENVYFPIYYIYQRPIEI